MGLSKRNGLTHNISEQDHIFAIQGFSPSPENYKVNAHSQYGCLMPQLS
jgi:hypothetical protein